MTRYPNPFAALTQLFNKAFATLADRDGPVGNAFVVDVSHSKTRRSSRDRASPAQPRSTPAAVDATTKSPD